jgi:hypothetical protein
MTRLRQAVISLRAEKRPSAWNGDTAKEFSHTSVIHVVRVEG